MEDYYSMAQKLATKEYRYCIQHGLSPYLPVLDDILGDSKSLTQVDLGTVQVPGRLVVGTKTTGRAASFARNFMPLLQRNSEFGMKWSSLCKSHVQEGIHDVVKLYEYMNHFYVEEGNKRVSVLKFFNAPTISAHVIRILPVRNGLPEVEVYYEFLEFYKLSKLNSVIFSKTGSYARLQAAMGLAKDQVWTEEQRKEFETFFFYFCQAYDACGGKGLHIGPSDALLAFLKFCPYATAVSLTPGELKKELSRGWEEILLLDAENPISLSLNPTSWKTPILNKLLPVGQRPLRVAFLYDKTPETSGWTYGHELGRLHVERAFRNQVVTSKYENAVTDCPEELIEQAISDGNTLIFTTTPLLMDASLRVALRHPEVNILNCSLNISHYRIPTYYARMYEAKFIMGALAGSLAERDSVGYICDYPIYGVIAGINAFALGAKMVNPRVKVYLEWSCVDGMQPAIKRLRERGISLISGQDMPKPVEGYSNFGLFHITGDGVERLAHPFWHWGVYYENIIHQLLKNAKPDLVGEKGKAQNYWWGMSAGVVDVSYSRRLPEGAKRLAEFLSKAIRSGACVPFAGELSSQDGTIQKEMDAVLTPEQIITMDWLCNHVVGSIPEYKALDDSAKATVDVVGVEKATGPKTLGSKTDENTGSCG